MPAKQSRIDGFLSPSGSRTRKKPPRQSAAIADAPGIQLNFVDPRSYTVSTVRQSKEKGKETMGRGKRKGKGRRPRYGEEEEGSMNARPGTSSAAGPAKRNREWDVISENSDDAASVGSAEGTPERLGAVRLEAGKSQLQWGDLGRAGGASSEGSSASSEEEEEEERQKRRVVVSGDESDAHTPPRKEPDVIHLESEPDVTGDGTPPPIRSSPRDPLADMFSDIPDPAQPSSSGYTRAARRPPPAPMAASSSANHRRRRKREPTPEEEEESSVYESEDPEAIIASPPPYRRAPPSISKGKRRATAAHGGKKRMKRGRRGVVDPDEEEESGSGDEGEEDPEALVRELEMDTPVVVESRLRERNKKTEHQKRLEELKRRKEAKARGERYTSPVDVPSDGSDELIIVDKPRAKSSAKGTAPRVDPDEEESEGAWTVEDEEEMDGFIDDADKNEDDHDEISNLLPEQYQMARYQNLEYHFKVISQFLIHLLIRGPAYARERKKQYYRASYEAISRKLQSQKDSLVTSSVWKPDFKTSLETYPELVVSHLDEIEYGCDACHLTGRLSRFSGELRGRAYDRETFEDLEDEQLDSEDSEEEEHEHIPPPSRGPFKLGKFCRLRAEVFHEFSHWERSLYQSYKDAYSRLERRIRSGDRSLAGLTAKSLKDPDEVVQWLDSQGHIMSQFERLSGFEFDLQKLS